MLTKFQMHGNVLLWSNIDNTCSKLYPPVAIQTRFLQKCAFQLLFYSQIKRFLQKIVFSICTNVNFCVCVCVYYALMCNFQPCIPIQNIYVFVNCTILQIYYIMVEMLAIQTPPTSSNSSYVDTIKFCVLYNVAKNTLTLCLLIPRFPRATQM